LLKQRFDHGSSLVSLRAVVPEHEPFLAELYATTREDDLRLTDWDDAQKAAFCAWQFQLQQLDYTRNYPADGHWIIVRDDVPVGRVWVAERDDHLFVVDISLLPAHRGRGIGTLVLEGLFAEGDQAGLPVRLTAFRNNLRAIALFQRLGFRVHEEDEMLLVLERPASG
jgi:ribosomal protein S18 acetylase RimI-like enzyme